MTRPDLFEQWEMVIGLEVHVELNTHSKLFSSARNHFGDEPNTNISEVCTGQPGALPVLNREAVRKAVLLGLALDAEVARYSRFDRKSYFYPDSPRGFQITQFEMPIIKGGSIIADVHGKPMRFEIDRAHLEDDAGMLKHFPGFGGLDDNRAGVPLIEIVSTPCIRSPQEAVAYAMALRALLQYIDASDCNMEEGSLRMDANISVRERGEKGFRNKIEIKNMNSFSFMAMAIEAEAKRQIREYVKHPHTPHEEVITQDTYRWDPDRKTTVLMRRKETADDYRYFMEPDLPPLILEDAYIDSLREALPELPYAREKRYIEELGLAHEGAVTLVNEKKLADYFEEALKVTDQAKALCNWLIVEFAGRFKEMGSSIEASGIPPSHVGMLVSMIHEGAITGKIAKKVADQMIKTPDVSPKKIVEQNPDFQPMEDLDALEGMIDEVLKQNPQSIEDFRSGKEKAFGFLVGQVMKATRGKAPPKRVNELLRSKLNAFS